MMWNFLNKMLAIILIISTFYYQVDCARTRTVIRSGAGVRGRREGMDSEIGGYGSRQAAASLPPRPLPAALYSAPKNQAGESGYFESARVGGGNENVAGEEGGDSLDASVATTTELNNGPSIDEILAPKIEDEQEQIVDDQSPDSSTQASEVTESSSSGENEIEAREGTTEASVADEDEVPSGRYLTPNNKPNGQSVGGYAGSSSNGPKVQGEIGSIDENIIHPFSNNNNGIKQSFGKNHNYESSSGAFSDYYNSPRSASGRIRPLDQQQVENNFHYQQQYSTNGGRSAAAPADSSPAAATQDQSVGGYSNGPTTKEQQLPNYEQIAAVEQSYYSTGPARNQNNNGAQGGYYDGNNNNGGHPNNINQGGYHQQQQQQQQQYPQYNPPPQVQPHPRYIAQQPEQFYPTPSAGPIEQFLREQQLPINPLAQNRVGNAAHPGQNNGYNYQNPQPQQQYEPAPRENGNKLDEPQIEQQHQQNQQQQQPQLQESVNARANFPADNSGLSTNSGDQLNEFSFEGLNDNVVDSDLLERVQQIIEEHERQQKEFLARQSSPNNGNEVEQPNNAYAQAQPSSSEPNENLHSEIIAKNGPEGLVLDGAPKPSIYYELNGHAQQQGPGGYNNNARFSQQLQQRQQFNDQRPHQVPYQPTPAPVLRREQDSSGSPSKPFSTKKFANLDVQPAILTQHFTESGPASSLRKQNSIQPLDSGRPSYLAPKQADYKAPPQFPNQYQPQLRQQQQPNNFPPIEEHVENQVQNEFQPQQQQVQPEQFERQNYYRPQTQQVHGFSFPQQNNQQSGQVSENSIPSARYPQEEVAGPVLGNGQNGGNGGGYEQHENGARDRGGRNGGFTQQFRQEYTRLQPQAQQPIRIQSTPPQSYQGFQQPENHNSIESHNDGYDQMQMRPNIITKTIVIHEQPAPPGYEGEMTNRAIITADDLRGTGIEISTQQQQQPLNHLPDGRIGNEVEQPQQQQYGPPPQQYQFLTTMAQLSIGDQQPQQPNIIYLPLPVQQKGYQPQAQNVEPIIQPKPIYGIPLAPVLGPEEYQQQQQYRMTYLPPQYTNSIEASSNQIQSSEPPAQNSWDANLRAIYRLPSAGTRNGGGTSAIPDENGLTNPVPLVSQVVSLPTSSDYSQPMTSISQEISSNYGARIDSRRRTIRKRFSQAVASPLAGFFSVKMKSS